MALKEHIDNRIGGEVRYVFLEEGETLAYVPNEIRRCVAFLGYRDANRIEHVAGSACWIVDTRYGYGPACLITAAHVLDEISQYGDSVSIRLNYKDGTARWMSVNLSRWERHPDKNVDVAFLRIPIELEMDHAGCPTGMFATTKTAKEDKKEIEVGDEVFFSGLFWQHHGSSHNIPIVRVGNIASLREEKVETQFGPMDVYLVEARSIGGLSGSPVFMDVIAARRTKETVIGTMILNSRFRLVGLMNGHFRGPESQRDFDSMPPDELEKLNMGIAFMTPSDKILEGLDMYMEEDKKAEEEGKKRRFLGISFDSTQRTNVSMQTTHAGIEIPTPSKEQFLDDLKKASRKKD